MVARLYKKSIADKKESIKAIEEKIYQPMEEKRKGRPLKTKADLEASINALYTKQIKHRDEVRKELEEKRLAEAHRSTKRLSHGEQRKSAARLSSASYLSASDTR